MTVDVHCSIQSHNTSFPGILSIAMEDLKLAIEIHVLKFDVSCSTIYEREFEIIFLASVLSGAHRAGSICS